MKKKGSGNLDKENTLENRFVLFNFKFQKKINVLFKALLKTDLRTANVIALSEMVECLTLDRE